MKDTTLLHRIIKPNWLLQGEQISSQAFRPGPQDNKQMSVYDGDQVTAEEAWRHFTQDDDKPKPPGVLAITVRECTAQELRVCPDPATFPAHVLVDFEGLGKNRIKKKSQWLRDAAWTRGWQFRP